MPAKYVKVDEKECRVIITRFRSQEDLDKFSEKVGLKAGTLSNLTTDLFLPSLKFKNKKPGRKRVVSYKWKESWKGMPGYINEKKEAYAQINIYYQTDTYTHEDLSFIMDQTVSDIVKSAWYPKLQGAGIRNLRIIGGSSETKFPIYIISKNRAEICKTSEHLTRVQVKHYVVVEDWQYEEYMATVGQSEYTTVLTIPQEFFDTYETLYDFESRGEKVLYGPGAARNFCWKHSKDNGFAAHHVLDDNITNFYCLNQNLRVKCQTGAYIGAMEDHFLAHDNLAISGPHYRMFALSNERHPSHTYNTRIYSWLLIRNDLWDKGFKWRGTWNEDTILSLDVLKAGYATCQYYAFLQNKLGTTTLKGGNTEEFYSKEGTTRKSQMLADVHPDVAKVVWKFSRVHHEVDYSPFANNDPQFRPERMPHPDNYDYGMYMISMNTTNDYATKEELEAKYSREDAVFLLDGTGWQYGTEAYERYIESLQDSEGEMEE